MSKEQLRFPSGRTVRKVKQEAKKIKSNYPNNTEALNALAIQHGVNLPWDKALSYLEEFWDSWFAIHIFQEEANWQIDVRCKRFKLEEDTNAYAKSSTDKLKWAGGNNPLVMIDHKTNESIVLNNADVRLWRTKPESMNKISVSMDDMERVYAPITEWPKLFGNEYPTFGSLAWAVEYGDDDGKPKNIEKTSNLQGLSDIERIGIKIRAEQAGGNIIQILHSYDVLETNYYLITKNTVKEIESIIATLHELAENNNFLPSYYSGGIVFTAHFIANVLKECFDQITITSDNFNYVKSEDTDIDVNVINIFRIEDGFDSTHYNMNPYRQHITDNRETILSAFRCSQGLPPTFDENKWELVNTNPSAIAREKIPLTMDNLKVNEAWCKRHDLEELIFHSIGADEGLSRDDDFSDIYGLYKRIEQDDTCHNYPVYRVRHEDFNLNAT
jgi:hypothetical protein